MPLRFKASKTLLGIETPSIIYLMQASHWFKASKTLLGIETSIRDATLSEPLGVDSKPPKPF